MVTLNQDIPEIQDSAETAQQPSEDTAENMDQINAEISEEGHETATDKKESRGQKIKGWFKKNAVPIATTVSFVSLMATPFASIALIHHVIPVAWDLLAIASAVTAGFASRNFLAKKQSAENREHQDNLIVRKIEAVRDNVMDKVQDVVRNHEHVEEPAAPKHLHERVIDRVKDAVLNHEGATVAKHVHIHEHGAADESSDKMMLDPLDKEMEDHMKEHASDMVDHAHAPTEQAHAAAQGVVDMMEPTNAYYTIAGGNHNIVAMAKDKLASEQQTPSSPGKPALVK